MNRWIGAAALLAAMVLGRVVTDTLPTATFAEDPFLRAGSVGEPLSLRFADVTVHEVNAAANVIPRSGPGALPSGVFLVLDTEFVARGEPRRLAGAVLEDRDGRQFAPSSRTGCAHSQLPTGIPIRGDLCFDVPVDALEGLTLKVTEARWDPSLQPHRRDDIGAIDLGIDAERADELAAVETGLRTRRFEMGPWPPIERTDPIDLDEEGDA